MAGDAQAAVGCALSCVHCVSAVGEAAPFLPFVNGSYLIWVVSVIRCAYDAPQRHCQSSLAVPPLRWGASHASPTNMRLFKESTVSSGGAAHVAGP